VGPCLCGDPYCPYCGDPGAAAVEEAGIWAMERLAKARLTADEYRIVVRAGLAAVKASRTVTAAVVADRLAGFHLDVAGMHAQAVSLEEELEALRAFKRSVDVALNSGDGAYRP